MIIPITDLFLLPYCAVKRAWCQKGQQFLTFIENQPKVICSTHVEDLLITVVPTKSDSDVIFCLI